MAAIVLKLLSERESMYGYEISQLVKERTGGKIRLRDGSLYPALQKMTADGLVTFREEIVDGRVRKYYSLTKHGSKVKTEQLSELRDFLSTIIMVVFPEASLKKP